jgi:hypothetical protein
LDYFTISFVMAVGSLNRHGPWTHSGRRFHIDAVDERDLSLQ